MILKCKSCGSILKIVARSHPKDIIYYCTLKCLNKTRDTKDEK